MAQQTFLHILDLKLNLVKPTSQVELKASFNLFKLLLVGLYMNLIVVINLISYFCT